MNEDNLDTLLTAIVEFEMDPTTMRDWQEQKEVPTCSDLLDFFDLQAHDSKKQHA